MTLRIAYDESLKRKDEVMAERDGKYFPTISLDEIIYNENGITTVIYLDAIRNFEKSFYGEDK